MKIKMSKLDVIVMSHQGKFFYTLESFPLQKKTEAFVLDVIEVDLDDISFREIPNPFTSNKPINQFSINGEDVCIDCLILENTLKTEILKRKNK